MSENIPLRQQNPEETENMAQYESPDGDAICASYVAQSVAQELGEFAELELSEEATVEASNTNTTANYAVYETPNGVVTGLYISHDTLAEIHGDEPSAENAPESVGLSFSPSSEEAWEEAVQEEEDEAEAEAEGLLAVSSDSDSEEDEEADELVEISDEELDIEA